MISGLIDPQWLLQDPHVGGLVRRNVAEMPAILADVDEEVLSRCAFYQINLYDLPLVYSTGTGTTSATDTTITGIGTAFDTEVVVGKIMAVGDEKRIVESVVSATELTINMAFSSEVSGASFEVSGFLKTIPLKRFGVAYALKSFCERFHGSGQGVKDVYYDKIPMLVDKVKTADSHLSKKAILGIYDPDTGVPAAPEDLGSSSSGVGYL